MLVEKEAQIANFNIVFGEDEIPMLEYFDTFIYPAFVSGISRRESDAEYLIKGVQLIKNIYNEYVLVGKIIKKTMLEIHTDVNLEGELIEKEERHSTAPYSTFAIFLKNHRMVFVPNQKGSPTLASFRSTIYKVFIEFRKRINLELDDDKKIPDVEVKVVGIPSMRSLLEVLRNVEKINELKLRFYPLNGDQDLSGLFGAMTTDLRKAVGSKKGEVTLRSPKNVEGVANVLADAAGTVEPIIVVTTKEKAKLKLKETEITERYKISLNGDMDFERESREIVKEIEQLNIIEFTNEQHEEIYERNIRRILKFSSED